MLSSMSSTSTSSVNFKLQKKKKIFSLFMTTRLYYHLDYVLCISRVALH